MIDHRKIVGNFFEEKVSEIFNLERTDRIDLPDRISKDKRFYVEIKGSSYINGGVIKKEQLYKFDDIINARRFYAFGYHSIKKDMMKKYRTKKTLLKDLDLRSLFLFPFSIVKAHYENSKKRYYQDYSQHKTIYYVQIKESLAKKIFNKNKDAWKALSLDTANYKFFMKRNIHVITREGNLEDALKEALYFR
jgi:hypothetical protein